MHLFAGLRVRDFAAARAWYGRLLGEPTFFPHATGPCGRSPTTARSTSSKPPSARGTASSPSSSTTSTRAWPRSPPAGVRKVVYRDLDGNEVGLGGARLDAAE
jgi:catechol 2,3-dioxygenase-like lactoylglutathione lyase family enzyme